MTEAAEERLFDLIIVGAGMVGSALGCAMAKAGFEVCLLEAREPQQQWPSEEVDLRVSALSRASQRLLENLGVWARMCELRVSPYTDMHVWDATGNGVIHFSAADIGEANLGHIVENRVTQLALWERLGGYGNLLRLCPASIASLETGASPALRLTDGRRLRGRLVVGADGRDSRVRELAGIASQGWDYDQHAIVATIRPERPHRHTAWQRFMPTGPLAFLPIDDGRCSIVWSTSPARAEGLLGLADDAFCTQLTQASAGILGEIRETGPRGVFPLRLGHAQRYIREGLALVGDAAHAIHPLAGQGVNLGFLDAACLVDVLIEARRGQRQIGSRATLRRYERARKGANLAMLGAMDFFKRFFGNEVLPLRLARNLGLNLVDQSGPLKHLIMRQAMGLAGDLPSLANTTRRS